MSSKAGEVCVGVLALQGAFIEHEAVLNQFEGVKVKLVKTKEDLETVDGLIIPGGESTTMALVAQQWNLLAPLRSYVSSNKPVFGTCAGLILLSDHILQGEKIDGQQIIGGLHVSVARNFYGPQTASFQQNIHVPTFSRYSSSSNNPEELISPAVFIRAPAILKINNKELVEVLCSLKDQVCYDGSIHDLPVAIRQNFILATTFHPELTHDNRWHRLFIDLVKFRLANKPKEQ